MLVKAIIISVMSTGMLGSSVNVMQTHTPNDHSMFPIGVEISAGPVRIESAKGKGFTVSMEGRTQMAITFVFQDDRSFKLKL